MGQSQFERGAERERPVQNPVAVRTKAFEIIETGFVTGLHVCYMGAMVVNLDARGTSFRPVYLRGIKAAALALQLSMILDELGSLFGGKARLSLLLEVSCDPRISFDPRSLLLSRRKC